MTEIRTRGEGKTRKRLTKEKRRKLYWLYIKEKAFYGIIHFQIQDRRQRVKDRVVKKLEDAGESSKKCYPLRVPFLTQFLQQRVRHDDRAVIFQSLLTTSDAQHAPTHPHIQVKCYSEIQHLRSLNSENSEDMLNKVRNLVVLLPSPHTFFFFYQRNPLSMLIGGKLLSRGTKHDSAHLKRIYTHS